MSDKEIYTCPFCDGKLSSRNISHKRRSMFAKNCPHCNNELSYDPYYNIPLKPLNRAQIGIIAIIFLISILLILFLVMQ